MYSTRGGTSANVCHSNIPSETNSDILDWNISDPKGKSIDEVRKIRDQIEIKVKELVKNLKESPST